MDLRLLVMASVVAGIAACGGSEKKGASVPEPSAAAAADAAPAVEEADAGDAGPPERPFAGSASEATELITAAVDARQEGLARCVKEYRFRKHLAHEKVSVGIGIDQEGRLIGVTLPKGKNDKELSACVQEELRDATFPRSHAGVITITRTFQEMVK